MLIMDRRTLAARMTILLLASRCAFAAPTTAPAPSGNLDLTFTQRSPESSPAAMARRTSLTLAQLGDDYDLSQRPYKAYVPSNYDPTVPVGIFVYLGYKDSTGAPPLWAPVLDKHHLIFITPVCHSGKQYAPAVPAWQSMGLAFDAVYNLEQQYNIDRKRIYMMAWANSTQMSLDMADVFTGFVLTYDETYFGRITMSNGSFYPPNFAPPDTLAMRRAKPRAFAMLDDQGNQEGNWNFCQLKLAAMKSLGFQHLLLASASLQADLHYVNFTTGWFENQVLPFLDAASAEKTQSPVAQSPGNPSQPAAPPESPAAHLLTMAKLLINNQQYDLARDKLQSILDDYPNDPAAATAQQLLDQIKDQQ